MSSIYGAWDVKGSIDLKEESLQAEEITGWWKPDSKWLYFEPGCYLGQQNLHSFKEVDFESDKIFVHSSGLKIVSDTRLDNRDALIANLDCEKDISNSQLILELYLKYKSECINYLLGAFAFAIWDSRKKIFFCGRDQLGIKPFNYYFKNGLFFFGTQKKSISFSEHVDKDADWRNIFNSASQLGMPPNSTNYLHIKLLAPGHFLKIENESISIKKYFNLNLDKKLTYKNNSDYVEHFNELLETAIICRLNSNNSIGTHLSGGLDSSGISSLAYKLGSKINKDIQFFSYNIPENMELKDRDGFSENLMAYTLVDYLNARDRFNLSFKTANLTFEQTVNLEKITCDGISKSNNARTEYEIQAGANHKDIQVMLSGFLGDELATSFCRPYYLEYLERGNYFKYFFSSMKSRHSIKEKSQAFFAANMAKLIPKFSEKISNFYFEKRYPKNRYAFNDEFINRDFYNNPNWADLQQPVNYGIAHFKFPTSLKQYQINHLTRPHTSRRIESEQLAGLSWKVNYRYPFSDLRLIEFMLSIPMEQKISKDTTRYIFRRAMKGLLPDELRLRDNKIAGSLKPGALFQPKLKGKSLRSFMNQLLESPATDFLNRKKITSWLDEKKSPYQFLRWIVIAQLAYENKIKL